MKAEEKIEKGSTIGRSIKIYFVPNLVNIWDKITVNNFKSIK